MVIQVILDENEWTVRINAREKINTSGTQCFPTYISFSSPQFWSRGLYFGLSSTGGGGEGGRLRRKLALILEVRPNKLLFDFFPDRVRLVAIVLTLPEIFACQDLMRKTVLSSVVVAYVPVS